MCIMKYNLLWLCVCLSVLIACQSRQRNIENNTIKASRPAMKVTQQDSIAVINMVSHFMDFLKEGKCDEAAAMIYELSKDNLQEEPTILDENSWKQMTSYLKELSVSEYHIEHIIFKQANDNEVKCSIQISNSYTTNVSIR